MSDDKANRGRQDRERIKMEEDYEVRDWSKKFGVSKDLVAAAVEQVGLIAKDVEAELRKGNRA